MFHPSMIEDEIYNILNSNPDYIVSSKMYSAQAIDAVVEYLSTCKGKWSLIDTPDSSEESGSVSICWIECDHLHHIVLNYAYTWED